MKIEHTEEDMEILYGARAGLGSMGHAWTQMVHLGDFYDYRYTLSFVREQYAEVHCETLHRHRILLRNATVLALAA